MIDRIEASQTQNFPTKSAGQTGPVGSVPEEDAQLQVNYAEFINRAQQIPQNDADNVQRARELLASGQLDAPENIQQAAQNIIDFGV